LRFAAGPSLVIAFMCVHLGCEPPLASKPSEEIESEVLSWTPRGTPIEEVRVDLERRGLEFVEAPLSQGGDAAHSDYPIRNPPGVHFLRVDLGEYGTPLATTAEVFYFFAEDGKLLQVEAKKYREGT
jgi:hypothetical protein